MGSVIFQKTKQKNTKKPMEYDIIITRKLSQATKLVMSDLIRNYVFKRHFQTCLLQDYLLYRARTWMSQEFMSQLIIKASVSGHP